jgi:dihydroneopterin aldolase/D-erythro-7,8-dihydroneopterin triphosphate epimerase
MRSTKKSNPFEELSMDQVFIKDLLVRGIIGINDWEREKPQDILINITISADLTRAGTSDNIADSINYRTIAKKAQALAETAQRLTVEALAADIAAACLEEVGVISVRVSVEKPNAVRFARSVGVEVERSRE